MHAMAKALLEWETIDADQIDDIMAGKPPRPPKDWTPPSPQAAGGPTPPVNPDGAPRRGLSAQVAAHRSQRGFGPASFSTVAMRDALADHPLSRIDLTRPRVMGIVNVTPDSFSDGGRTPTPTRPSRTASGCWREGADILDIGGESTPPGRRRRVPPRKSCARVLPVLRAALTLGVPVSVDTSQAAVMRAALDARRRHRQRRARTARPGALEQVAGRASRVPASA